MSRSTVSGTVLRHELNSLDAVRCLSDNRHMRKEAEEPAQQLAQDGVIVGEDDTRRCTPVLARPLGHSPRPRRWPLRQAENNATARSGVIPELNVILGRCCPVVG